MDAVADRGDIERGERVKVAGGQAAQPAIAQRRFGLAEDQLIQVEA